MPALARRIPKRSSPPPSRAVLEKRKYELRWQSYHAREELLRAYIDHLQRAVITPTMIEREAGHVSSLYRDCLILDLRTVSVREVVELHARLCQAIAFSLWKDGTIDPARGRILNLLADAIEAGGGWHKAGWQAKDGAPIHLG